MKNVFKMYQNVEKRTTITKVFAIPEEILNDFKKAETYVANNKNIVYKEEVPGS